MRNEIFAGWPARVGRPPARNAERCGGRDAAGHDGAAVGAGADLDRTAERGQTVAHVLQARAGGRAGQADAGTVVLDGERDLTVRAGQHDVNLCSGGMLAGILQGLHAAEVDGSLDLFRIPANPDGGEFHLPGRLRGLSAHRGRQPLVGQQRRIDPAGELPQLAACRAPDTLAYRA